MAKSRHTLLGLLCLLEQDTMVARIYGSKVAHTERVCNTPNEELTGRSFEDAGRCSRAQHRAYSLRGL